MASAALLVMIFFVLSRLSGLAREIIIGASYGTSAAYDAYLAAFRIPDLLFQLAAGGALGSAFIPVFAGYWLEADKRVAWLLFSRVLNLITLALVALGIIAAIFAEPIVRTILAPGFTLEQQLLTASLMRWMLLGTIVFGASGLIMGALNATQHFLAPAAAPVLYNAAIIAAAYFLAPTYGVYGLAVGVVAGALAHLLVQLPVLLHKGYRYRPAFSLADTGVRKVMVLMGPRVLGLFFVQLHFLVNTILASGLGAGAVSALNYAWLLMLLPQGIIAQGIATAIFPTLSAQAARGQIAALRSTLNAALRAVIWLTVPAAVGLFLLRTPLIQLFLQRGQFTADSTAMTAYALAFFTFGLVAHSLLEVITRAFYALHDTWTPVKIGIGAMVLNLILSLLLLQPLSFGGLALANTIATTAETLVLLWLIRPQIAGLGGRRLLASLGRALPGTLAMAGALLLFLNLAADWPTWLVVGGGILLGGAVYAIFALLLGRNDLQPLLRR